jgi:hypothetical protein
LLLAGALAGIAWTLVLFTILFVSKTSMERSLADGELAGAGPEIRDFLGLSYAFAAALYGVSLIGGVLVLMGRSRLHATLGAHGRSRALTGAILMLATFNLVGGGLALAGALTANRHA